MGHNFFSLSILDPVAPVPQTSSFGRCTVGRRTCSVGVGLLLDGMGLCMYVNGSPTKQAEAVQLKHLRKGTRWRWGTATRV
jgi:hypothetical protein